jgi:hypothetical protein
MGKTNQETRLYLHRYDCTADEICALKKLNLIHHHGEMKIIPAGK